VIQAADVELFVAPDSNVADAARGDALRRLVAKLGTDALSFLDLLRGMEGCLVTTDDARRARGVLLLAEAVAGYTNDADAGTAGGCPLPAAAATLLAQYFTSKLDDFAVIRAALMGCTALLRATAVADAAAGGGSQAAAAAPAVSHAAAAAMADRFFDAVHVPSLVQADRQRSYELLMALASHPDAHKPADAGAGDGDGAAVGPPLGSMSPAEQLESVVAACDGGVVTPGCQLGYTAWTILAVIN
jgi:DNA repair/transcription protein MET18/MMS19